MIEIKEYSGHIRNHVSLCKELSIEKGLSRQEREKLIIAKGYEKWGYSLPDHIYGMFAFVLYDTDENKYILFRDQFGTVPLYYYETADKKLLFGTQIRTIMKQDGFEKNLNQKLLQIYLT